MDGSINVLLIAVAVGSSDPAFIGLGIISSSGRVDVPDPNSSTILPSSLILDVNRLDVFFSFNKYGVSALYCVSVGSLYWLFVIRLATVSWARKGTSDHSLPSESVTLSIDMILVLLNGSCRYAWGEVTVNVCVALLPDWNEARFFNK